MAQWAKLSPHKHDRWWYISVIPAFLQQDGGRDRRSPRGLRASWPDLCTSEQRENLPQKKIEGEN